jgi:hypothetical protein
MHDRTVPVTRHIHNTSTRSTSVIAAPQRQQRRRVPVAAGASPITAVPPWTAARVPVRPPVQSARPATPPPVAAKRIKPLSVRPAACRVKPARAMAAVSAVAPVVQRGGGATASCASATRCPAPRAVVTTTAPATSQTPTRVAQAAEVAARAPKSASAAHVPPAMRPIPVRMGSAAPMARVSRTVLPARSVAPAVSARPIRDKTVRYAERPRATHPFAVTGRAAPGAVAPVANAARVSRS